MIGAAKSATTSLSKMLSEHPQAAIAKDKEPHFFAYDKLYARGLAWYETKFSHCSDEIAIGDASVSYARLRTHPDAVKRIKAHVPDAKIIFMVRHPIERIESGYVESLGTEGTVPYPSINHAICQNPIFVDSSRYWETYESYCQYFGANNVKVIWFEEFIHNPVKAFQSVCKFLAIDDTIIPSENAQKSNSRANAANRSANLGRTKTDINWDPKVKQWVVNELKDDSLKFLKHFFRASDYWYGLENVADLLEQKKVKTKHKDITIAELEVLLKSSPLEVVRLTNEITDACEQERAIAVIRGQALLALKLFGQAIDCAEQVISENEQDLVLLTLLFDASVRAADRKRTKKYLNKLIIIEDLPITLVEDLASAARSCEDHQLAKKLYNFLHQHNPDNGYYCLGLGREYQILGDMEKAQYYVKLAIEKDPKYSESYYFLSTIRKVTASDNHITLYQDSLHYFDLDSKEIAHVYYALAKEHEDIKQYDKASFFYLKGAKAHRDKTKYNAAGVQFDFELSKEFFKNKTYPSSTVFDDSPLFILGLPRTGSTLIERIISSHSDVDSVGEVGCFKDILRNEASFTQSQQKSFHRWFYQQSEMPVDLTRVAQSFLDRVKPSNFQGRYFIDKHPMNFVDIGMIALAFPNAKFINTCRNPLSSSFSNFKQIFSNNFYSYSYDMSETADYILLYQNLMRFWHEKFPGRILDVHYEDVIEDTETQARRIFDFLNLDWQAQCLSFHKRTDSVSTASLSQVRQPVYKTSKEAWKNFAELMTPAKKVFANAGLLINE
ncbi:MAG: sulfotransferase [Colwellia sp.]|nr:sulfotransferase [Colwellia sp.]MCW8863487.1 sulfotransferase [Colwellia sp.]MCW9079921.1 sulfotransferase [Colwellia sp.]